MRPTFEKTCQMFPSRSQFSPIFKRIDVLPRRLQILAQQTIVSLFLTIELLCYAKYILIKVSSRKISLVRLSLACDGRIFQAQLTLFISRDMNLSAAFIGSNFEDMYDFNERFLHQSIGAICNTSVN